MGNFPLNEEQKLAVEHPTGKPAVLIAGAGSGKTRVLTERVRWLMEQGVLPRKICCLTFTNKASGEMKDRLGLGIDTPMDKEPRVSTIHSLALSGIRKNPKAFGLQDHVTPLDEYDSSQLMKKVIEHYDSKHGQTEPRGSGFTYSTLEKISFHRARGVGFRDDYTDAVHHKALSEHAGYHALTEEHLDLWELFEDEKRKNSVVDFDDMLHLVVRRMRNDPQWKAVLQKQFDHVLMDEAQDTNPVQWEFVNGLLAPENPNLYVVGDMGQSIYGFNGAVPKILKDYSENWRDQTPIMYRIKRNHRSKKQIVRLANKIQKTMMETIPLQMEAFREEEGEWRWFRAKLPQNCAEIIAQQIKNDSARKQDPILFRENAILVRSGAQVRDIEGELVRRRIPYIVRGGRGLLQTEEVRDILSYLRLVVNRKDFSAFMRCCAVPRCGVGEAALNKLRIDANQRFDGDLLEAAKENERLHNLIGIIDMVAEFREMPLTAVEKLLALFDYRKYQKEKYKKDPDKVSTKLENIERFVLMVQSLTTDTNMTLDDLIFQLALDRTKGDETEKIMYDRQLASGELTQMEYDRKMEEIRQGSVTISTIHSAKGLEWKRVYVTNVYEGSLPNRFSMGSDEEIEEERRLFYVACTRAKDILILSVPEVILGQGPENRRPQRVAPSRFLREVDALPKSAASNK
jgi:DNA helicase II / ATP-dependent DNA helicase PcrA